MSLHLSLHQSHEGSVDGEGGLHGKLWRDDRSEDEDAAEEKLILTLLSLCGWVGRVGGVGRMWLGG